MWQTSEGNTLRSFELLSLSETIGRAIVTCSIQTDAIFIQNAGYLDICGKLTAHTGTPGSLTTLPAGYASSTKNYAFADVLQGER